MRSVLGATLGRARIRDPAEAADRGDDSPAGGNEDLTPAEDRPDVEDGAFGREDCVAQVQDAAAVPQLELALAEVLRGAVKASGPKIALAAKSSALTSVSGPMVCLAFIAATAPMIMLTIQPTTASRMSLLIDIVSSSSRFGVVRRGPPSLTG